MADVIFREAQAPTPVSKVAKPSTDPVTQRNVEIEPPFTFYTKTKNKSYIADYFGIDEGWGDKDAYGGDIDEIETYFKDKVERGHIENTTEAVKTLLKKYEKAIGLDKSERMVVKIAKMIAYLNFRRTVDGIERDSKKYGTTR
jgi:hypothetical protein